MRALPPCSKVSTMRTGVPKSATSSRRSRLRGTLVLMEVDDRAVWPCWRMSMPVLVSDRSTTTRPSPLRPRRKSTSRSACVLVGAARLGEALRRRRRGLARRGRAGVGQRDQDVVAFDLRVERLRLVQIEHDARAVAGLHDIAGCAAPDRRRRADRCGQARSPCRGNRARSAAGW